MADITFTKVLAVGPGWNKVLASDGNIYTFSGDYNWRSNNPGNIEYGPFAISMGAIGSGAVPAGRQRGFAIFPSYEAGQAARTVLQFESKKYKDLTVGQAIAKYAPSFENDVGAYVRTVTKAAGVSRGTKMSDLTPTQRQKFLAAQQTHEGWRPGKIMGTAGQPVPASVVQQFKGRALPPLDILSPNARQNIATQRAEQSQMRNRVIPPMPGRRPETVNGKVIKPLPAPAPLSFGKAGTSVSVGKGASAATAARPAAKAPVSGLIKVVPGRPSAQTSVVAKPAVSADGRTVAQIAQAADNARLTGYRAIQELGPSSKGAKPTTTAKAAPKSGAIKTVGPDQEPIPHNVVPASIKAIGGGTGSTLPTKKPPVDGLIQLRVPGASSSPLTAGATKATPLAAGASAAVKSSAAAVVAQKQAAAADAQRKAALAAQQAQVQARAVAAQRLEQERVRQRNAAAQRAAIVAAQRQQQYYSNGVANPAYRNYGTQYQSEGGGIMPANSYGGNGGGGFTDSLGGTYYDRHL